MRLTLGGPVEAHVELLHAVVDERDLVVRHKPVRPLSVSWTARADGYRTHIFITSVSIRRFPELYIPQHHQTSLLDDMQALRDLSWCAIGVLVAAEWERQ